MKTIGILGGLGPEATVDYYKEIIEAVNQRNNNGSLNYPEIVIYSVNMSRFIGLLENKKYLEASNYIAHCINGLDRAGAEFAVMSANTPHLLFEDIKVKVPIPLISIVDSTLEKANALGFKRCGLVGTIFTMEASFYSDTFKKQGIEIVVPNEKEKQIINNKLFQELELGIFKEETKTVLLNIFKEFKEREGIDSLILGCTEFPVMFTEDEYLGIPFLNTTRIHVEQIVDKAYEAI
ncbi:MAG TPA: amino acid racemase [Sunxiuqinia sp.]|nr:amino acid racemase [Sunxiuqinia sp.]